MLLPDWRERLGLRYSTRAMRRRRAKYQPKLQTLEARALLSVTPVGVTMTPVEEAAFTGTVATFTSTDAGPFSASIDWGDGTTSGGTVGSSGGGSFTVNGTHTYAEDGTEPVSVEIIDTADATTATALSTAHVQEGAFGLTAGSAISTTEGMAITNFHAATFQDTGSPDPASDYTATIGWGDGATTAGTVSGSGGNYTVTGNHTYTDELTGASYLVTVAEPSANFTFGPVGASVTVAEGDTLVPGTASVSTTEGQTFTGTVATFSDTTYPANVATDFNATIDWGDGTVSAGTVSGGSGADFTVSGNHAYADEGSFTLTVTLNDDAPGTATATATGTASVAEGDSGDLIPATITPTEGQVFSGQVASFTDTGNPLQVAGDWTATVDWGDGTTTAGTLTGPMGGPFTINGSHSYADEGTFTLLATFSDDPPSTLTNIPITSTAIVAEGDVLTPSATAVTLTGTEGTTLSGNVATFTNTGYADNSAADFTATIDWGDGTTTAGTVSGGSGSDLTVSGGHAYADEGAFTITTMIADDAPGTATATTVALANVAEADTLTPQAVTTGSILESQFVGGTAAVFVDAGYPTNNPADFTGTFDWGDGTTYTTGAGNVSITSDGAGDFTLSVAGHAYADEGVYTVVATLNDDAPGTATDAQTGTLTVTDADSLTPSATPITLSGTEGMSLGGSVAAFTNAGYASNPAADFTATIDWGDGTTTAGTVSGGSGADLTVSGTHTYAEDGAYTISTTIADDAPGTATATATSTANVGELSLALGGIPVAATEGQLFSGAVAMANDPGSTDPAADFSATIDWGDGTTTAGTVSGTAGTYTVSGSHIYADEGAFRATVTFVENDDPTFPNSVSDVGTVAEADALTPKVVTTGSIRENEVVSGTAAIFFDAGYPTNNPVDFTGTFDWGDGTTYTTGAGNVFITSDGAGDVTLSVAGHAYADEGVYKVVATLSDDAPGTATDAQTGTLTVTDADSLTPSATPITLTGTEGTSLSGSVATFTNVGYASNPASDFTATIDWGDGTTTAGTVSGGGGADLTVSGNHAYTDEGVFTITTTIADDAPGTDTATFTATANVAEGDFGSLTPTTVTPTEGQTFSGAVASFTDPGNPLQVAGDWTASIDWGDGTTTAGTVTGPTGGPFTINGSHSYADEGTFTVLATFSDDPPSTLTDIAITSTAQVSDSDTLLPGMATVSATEGTTYTGAVATFTDTTYAGNLPADFTATIDWGDGTTSVGTVSGGGGTFTVSGSHVYADEGSNALSVVLSDDAPGTASATATGTASVADNDMLSGTATATATEGTTFTGAVATFIDTTYAGNLPADFTATIDWGDGTTDVGTVSGGSGTFTVSGSHLYVDEGSNPLSVVLTDNAPGTASATATGTARVADNDTLVAGSAVTGNSTEGSTFSGKLATFTDTTYAANLPGDFTASIDWGDGTTTAGTLSGATGSFTISGSHVYAEEGTKTATIVLSDDAPGTATGTATATINVADATLSATGTAVTSPEATFFSGVVATFSDADPSGTVTDYTASIDWGDGTTSSGVVGAAGSGFSVTSSHTYAEDGSFTITVFIADVGGSKTTATSTATITEPSLTLSPVAVSGFERSSTTFAVATFTHGNGGEPPSGFTAAIDWGDGTSSTGVVSESGGTYTVSGTHSYLDEGTFTVGVQVSDEALSAAVTTSAVVKEELLPNGTEGTPNQRFIQEVYRDLLHRAVDATALPYWSSMLDQGVSRLQVVLQIMAASMPGELGADLVTGIFQKYLGRDPDSAGLAYWVGVISTQATLEQTEAAIVGGPEFFALSGSTNTGFITRLFNLALGRAPEPAVVAQFNADLAAGASRAQVAAAVFNSHEFHQDEVAGYYQSPEDLDEGSSPAMPFIDDLDFLDRPADSSGLAAFTAALDQGVSDELIWAGMMASDEYFAKIA